MALRYGKWGKSLPFRGDRSCLQAGFFQLIDLIADSLDLFRLTGPDQRSLPDLCRPRAWQSVLERLADVCFFGCYKVVCELPQGQQGSSENLEEVVTNHCLCKESSNPSFCGALLPCPKG